MKRMFYINSQVIWAALWAIHFRDYAPHNIHFIVLEENKFFSVCSKQLLKAKNKLEMEKANIPY